MECGNCGNLITLESERIILERVEFMHYWFRCDHTGDYHTTMGIANAQDPFDHEVRDTVQQKTTMMCREKYHTP